MKNSNKALIRFLINMGVLFLTLILAIIIPAPAPIRLLICAVGLIVLQCGAVISHAKSQFRCSHCGHVHKPTILQSLIRLLPRSYLIRYMKCPHCYEYCAHERVYED
jgi:predicted membrane channel-forming protein YqfA (hemolysin III family)